MIASDGAIARRDEPSSEHFVQPRTRHKSRQKVGKGRRRVVEAGRRRGEAGEQTEEKRTNVRLQLHKLIVHNMRGAFGWQLSVVDSTYFFSNNANTKQKHHDNLGCHLYKKL